MINDILRSQIIQLAHAEYPREACGLIVDNKIVLQALNIADNPTAAFVLVPTAWMSAGHCGDSVTHIWHTHTNGNNSFSASDIRSCKASGIPWYLFSLPDGREAYFDPTTIAPLLGRSWHYGAYDCYSLMRDIYHGELGIILDDFDRGEVFEWTSPGWNMFAANFEKQGFSRCTGDVPLQKYDIFLMQIQSPNPNHVGVLMEPSMNHFFHHLYGRLSECSVYGGYWEKVTHSVWRHKSIRNS